MHVKISCLVIDFSSFLEFKWFCATKNLVPPFLKKFEGGKLNRDHLIFGEYANSGFMGQYLNITFQENMVNCSLKIGLQKLFLVYKGEIIVGLTWDID